jgi:uncharacterized phiE125 gp8 family phage protein
MWRPVVSVVGPTLEPITIESIKDFVRIDDDTEDTTIARFIRTARAHVESVTSTKMVTQTVYFRTDKWSDFQRLPVAPVRSVTSIQYVDVDGQTQTVDPTIYEANLEGLEPEIVLVQGNAWPTNRSGSLIRVNASVGYGAPGEQPDVVIQCIAMMVADFYAQRETFSPTGAISAPLAADVDAMLSNHRIGLI